MEKEASEDSYCTTDEGEGSNWNLIIRQGTKRRRGTIHRIHWTTRRNCKSHEGSS